MNIADAMKQEPVLVFENLLRSVAGSCVCSMLA